MRRAKPAQKFKGSRKAQCISSLGPSSLLALLVLHDEGGDDSLIPLEGKSQASRNQPFTGDYDANVMTGENWIKYQRDNLGKSDYQIAYSWGLGPTAGIRDTYANEAISLRDRYAKFVDCLKTGR
jgi:hypothetical protein